MGVDGDILGSGTNAICAGERSFISAEHILSPMDSWQWILPSYWNTVITANSLKVSYPPSGSSDYVSVRAHNSCGWTAWKTMYVPVENCSGPMMLSPNPVSLD
jgi:hypothetical protein